MTTRRSTSGSPYEEAYGFCRAIRRGERIWVAGTAPIEDDGTSTPGDAAAQTRRCFAKAVAAIEELGGSASDVVATRMYITDPDDSDAIGKVHAEFFAAAPPAALMVVVKQLLRPEWKVEIEAEAVVA